MRGARPFRSVAAIFVALAIHAAAVAGVLIKMPAPDAAVDSETGGVMLLIATTAAGSSAGQEKPKHEVSPVQIRPETPVEPEPEPVPPKEPDPQISLEKQPAANPIVQAVPVKNRTLPRREPVPIPKRKPVRLHHAATIPALTPVMRDLFPAPVVTAPPQSVSSAATSGDRGVSRQTQIARNGGGEVRAHGEYFAIVRNWLHDHKRYPRRARIRMIRGEATVGFVLDRSGRVVSYELRKSTGHDILDREVLAMIRRASPMPPFPPGLRREKINFNVPVNFDMR